MDLAPKRGEYTDAPVAEFIAAPFDEDVLVAGHSSGGSDLVLQIAKKVFRSTLIQAVIFD
jgi:hypothetical protein